MACSLNIFQEVVMLLCRSSSFKTFISDALRILSMHDMYCVRVESEAYMMYMSVFLIHGTTAPSGAVEASRSHSGTQHSVGLLDEQSARRRSYLTTHDTHKRQTSMTRWDSNPHSQQARG